MDLTGLLERRGGLATRAEILACRSQAELSRALREGDLVRVGRGRYVLPAVPEAEATAHRMNAVLCQTNAALHHGWQVKWVPERPHLLFPRHRNIPIRWRREVQIHRGDLLPDDVSAGVATSRELTLMQCLRSLPDDEALCVADSALRAGEVATLARVRATARGAGAAKVRRIADAARGEAANPFESCLRALALRVPGLRVEPQRVISTDHTWARPDLVDDQARIVLEADSFEWHGSRQALARDAQRYNQLVADGWLVLRFTWEDVMFRPEEVTRLLVRTVRQRDARTELLPVWPEAA